MRAVLRLTCGRSVATEAVIDCSALVDALIREDATGEAARVRVRGTRLHAPHLLDAEVGQVLRRKVRGGYLPKAFAPGRLRAARIAVAERYPHIPLMDAAWQLHENVSFYDALYVALAARLGLPLVTTDSKLTETSVELPCRVELVNGSS